MKTINSYLPALSNGQPALTEVQLVKINTKNIPSHWKIQFKLSDGHKLTTSIEEQKKLRLIEKAEKQKLLKKNKSKEEKFRKGKDREVSKEFKNKCNRCTDDHEWYDCPKYNKNSKAYKANHEHEFNVQEHARDSSRERPTARYCDQENSSDRD